MKKLITLVMLTVLLAGGTLGALPALAQAPVYAPPPVVQPVANPWIGPNTPWVYYNGDWFLNGILHYFFGQRYGWAPYYTYPTTYIVRPGKWYGPKWNSWYQAHPVYWQNFHHSYPYWRSHRVGHRYNEDFYRQYHHGQGGGWHHGWHGEH